MSANAEFFEALRLLEKEKGIESGYLMEKIEAAIVLAVKKDYGGRDNILVKADPASGELTVLLQKRVVEEVLDPEEEFLPEEAARYQPGARPGDTVEIVLETRDFGRIAAQTAKHVIRQGIREAERNQKLREIQRYNQELVTAMVTHIDPRTGNATVEIGRNEAILPQSEQMPGDAIRPGQRIKVYVVDVKESERGARLVLSRTHPGLVRRLFEQCVPEIFDGTVEIRAIAREAGSRTKLAVCSKDGNVDAIGACIGPKGTRVNEVVEELCGEKMDIMEYSEDPATFIAAALAPSKVVSVELDENEELHSCRVTVPDNQLSLAIGPKGQNARLAARLTGWKIDIRPESGFFGEEPAAQ